jgi:hypothetical protein
MHGYWSENIEQECPFKSASFEARIFIMKWDFKVSQNLCKSDRDVFKLAILTSKCLFLCNLKDIASHISSNEFYNVLNTR